MNKLRTILFLIAVTLMANSCAKHNDHDSSDADSSSGKHKAAKSAHTLEELEEGSLRAKHHHTVYVELKHPQSETPEKAVRTIPYTFDFATTQTVCLEAPSGSHHTLEVHEKSADGVLLAALTDAHPCEQVSFRKGDYAVTLSHGGTGSHDDSTHVFAHAKFTRLQDDIESSPLFSKGIISQDTSNSPFEKSSQACQKVETVAFEFDATNRYLQTTYPARTAAYFELYKVSAPGWILTPNDREVSSSSLVDVYRCGSNFKFASQTGAFLKSQCGYPIFSATTIDDATAYTPHWDSDRRRLELQNSETAQLIKVIERSAGRVVKSTPPRNDPNQPSIGTCSTFPADLQSSVQPIEWANVLIFPENNNSSPLPVGEYEVPWGPAPPGANYIPGVFMATEFEYKPLGTFTYFWRSGRYNGVTPIYSYTQLQYYHLGPQNLTTFHYPDDVEVRSALIPNRQEVMLFSFGSCKNCDLTNLDVSNRRFQSFDVSGSRIEDANFNNTVIASGTFDNATILGSDFSNAKIIASSFQSANIASTTFNGTVLSEQGFGTTFEGAQISDQVHFENMDLSSTSWAGASISNSSFENVSMSGSDLSGATLQGVTITNSPLSNSSFSGANLSTVTFDQSPLHNVDFSGSTVAHVGFANGDISNATFAGAHITASTFNNCFALGANFSNTTWTGSSFDEVDAYSDGLNSTTFEGCTIVSGSFANSLFMQSSFNNCRLQGGGFSGSNFAAATLRGITSQADATDSQLSFSRALLAGTDFSGASLDGADLTNSIISTKEGSVDIVIRTSPDSSETRTYNYSATVKPATTSASTYCPHGDPGPCQSDTSWTPVNPPHYTGHEDPNSW